MIGDFNVIIRALEGDQLLLLFPVLNSGPLLRALIFCLLPLLFLFFTWVCKGPNRYVESRIDRAYLFFWGGSFVWIFWPQFLILLCFIFIYIIFPFLMRLDYALLLVQSLLSFCPCGCWRILCFLWFIPLIQCLLLQILCFVLFRS